MSESLDILYEDDDLLVVNKPAGISVHPSAHEPRGTLVDLIIASFPEVQGVGDDPLRPGIVHRLDKDTSGVLVVAKNQESFLELRELFRSRKIEKRYLAIAAGHFKERRGTITLPIGRVGMKRAVSGRRQPKKTREAITNFQVRRQFKDAALVELRPKTGRMHQLRVHLAALQHPILGDKLYGGKRAAHRAPRQMLHAVSLTFSRHNGKRYTFETDPPEDFANTLLELQEAARDNDAELFFET